MQVQTRTDACMHTYSSLHVNFSPVSLFFFYFRMSNVIPRHFISPANSHCFTIPCIPVTHTRTRALEGMKCEEEKDNEETQEQTLHARRHKEAARCVFPALARARSGKAGGDKEERATVKLDSVPFTKCLWVMLPNVLDVARPRKLTCVCRSYEGPAYLSDACCKSEAFTPSLFITPHPLADRMRAGPVGLA